MGVEMTNRVEKYKSVSHWPKITANTLAGLAVALLMGTASTEVLAQGVNTPSQAEMWEIIQRQQRQIKKLQRAQGGGGVITETSPASVGSASPASDSTAAYDDDYGDAGTGWWTRTSIGGYGELHWNNGQKDEIDFHRFVLFINHDFNDWIHFFSELEVEHVIAGEGKNGEIELEQAWVRFDVMEDKFGPLSKFIGYIDIGQMLIPAGIINEIHEPPTFFGVERNDVEKNIIPATWWEAGARIGTDSIGESGLGWDLMVHSGLAVPTTGSSAYKIRSGRQKVSEAAAEDAAYTARVKYRPTFLPGWEVAGSYQYQEDITSRDGHDAGADDESAKLWTAHIDGKQNVTDNLELRFRALYAMWDISSTAASAIGRDQQEGWYVEPGMVYDTQMWAGKFGVFYRYESFDNEAGSGDALDTEITRQSYGANWWPTENVVIKGEYREDNHYDSTKNDDRWDFGLGYQF